MWIGPGPSAGSPSGSPPGRQGPCCTSQQMWSSVSRLAAEVLPPVAGTVVDSMVGHADQAQQAVSEGLLRAAGVSLDSLAIFAQLDGSTVVVPQPGTPAYAAGARFAALPAAERHAWLTAHLAELRVGRITLEQLP